MDGKWIVIRAYFKRLDVRLTEDITGEEDIEAQVYCDSVILLTEGDRERVLCNNDDGTMVASIYVGGTHRIRYPLDEIADGKIKDNR